MLGFVRQGDLVPEKVLALTNFSMDFLFIERVSSDDEDDDPPIDWKVYFGLQIVDSLLKQPYAFISYSPNGFESWLGSAGHPLSAQVLFQIRGSILARAAGLEVFLKI